MSEGMLRRIARQCYSIESVYSLGEVKQGDAMRFAGIYGIIVGILIFAEWFYFLLTAQVPELDAVPFETVFHLAAEFLTSMIMVAGGVAVLRREPWASRVYYLASGMLLYAVINGVGYFVQLREWSFVAILAVLFLLTVVSVGKVVRAVKT